MRGRSVGGKSVGGGSVGPRTWLFLRWGVSGPHDITSIKRRPAGMFLSCDPNPIPVTGSSTVPLHRWRLEKLKL